MTQFVLDLRTLMSMTNICWAVLVNGPTLRNLEAAMKKQEKVIILFSFLSCAEMITYWSYLDFIRKITPSY